MDLKIKITNVKKVKLEKGDTLFFELGAPMTTWVEERLAEKLKGYFPDQKILILPKGITLKKIGHTKEKE